MSYLLDNRKREMGSPKTFFFASFPACELLYTKGWPRKAALIRVFTAKESENNGRSSLSQHKKNRVISYLNGAKLEKTPLFCHKGVLYEAKCRI